MAGEHAGKLTSRIGRLNPMPGRTIWGRESDFPAVAFSGFGSQEDTARTRAAGFHTHLTKPVHPNRLRSVIEEALHEGGARRCASRTGGMINPR